MAKVLNAVEKMVLAVYVHFFRYAGDEVLSVEQRGNEIIIAIKFSTMAVHDDHIDIVTGKIERTIKDEVVRVHKYWAGRSAVVVVTIKASASGSKVWAGKLAETHEELKARMKAKLAALRAAEA